MTFADKLNKHDVSFTTGKKGLTLEACEGTHEELCAVQADLDHHTVAYVDYDPRDRRCGLVVYAECRGEAAWFDENGDCCWKETRPS